jgi:hypothetical protein
MPYVHPSAPVLSASATSVVVSWVDNLTNETQFQLWRVGYPGSSQLLYTTPTVSATGTGSEFAFVDTDTTNDGQCYEIVASGGNVGSDSGPTCTVRPDPTHFPQTIPAGAIQWTGLDSYGYTSHLFNSARNGYLIYSHRTLGVDLNWDGSSSGSQFTVEPQANVPAFGVKMMKGEPVAIHIPGQGYLTTGSPAFGIGLDVHRQTPSYEWYVLGGNGPGSPLGDGTFALWNSVRKDYLVFTNQISQGIGLVDLFWYKDVPGSGGAPGSTGVNTYRLYNCALDQQAVSVWIKDVTNGTPYARMADLNQQYGADGCPTGPSVPFTYHPPVSGHHYSVVAVDKQLGGACQHFDNPTNGCNILTTEFVSDLSYKPAIPNGPAGVWNGVIRTDVVNSVTQINPCTLAICGPVPTPSGPAPAPDFTLTSSQGSANVTQTFDGKPAITTVQITLSALNGFTGAPTLTIAGLPTGVSAGFSPDEVSVDNPSSTLSLLVDDTVAPGTYPLTISTDSTLTGTGKSITYYLTIDGEGPPPPPTN